MPFNRVCFVLGALVRSRIVIFPGDGTGGTEAYQGSMTADACLACVFLICFIVQGYILLIQYLPGDLKILDPSGRLFCIYPGRC